MDLEKVEYFLETQSAFARKWEIHIYLAGKNICVYNFCLRKANIEKHTFVADYSPIFFFKFFLMHFKFIYLFIFGCVGSSFLCEGFL